MRSLLSASSKSFNFPFHPTGGTGRVENLQVMEDDKLTEQGELQALQKELEGMVPLVQTNNWAELRSALAVWVNELIQHDMQELIRILYRIDISEPKLKFLLKEKVGEDAALIIADLIIERQLQKIKTRQQFQQPPPEDDEDRW